MRKVEQGCGKVSKGNKLKAPYKDRPSKDVLQIRNEKLFHYKNLNESLSYKERMAKVKTADWGEERKQKMKEDKNKKRGMAEGDCQMGGKINKRVREDYTGNEESNKGCQTQAILPTPWVKGLHYIGKYQKSTKLLIRKWSFKKLVTEFAQEITLNLRFQTSALRALKKLLKVTQWAS